jgi:glutathione synthase/RimK-type ligase-like ATP-grasp enzyme
MLNKLIPQHVGVFTTRFNGQYNPTTLAIIKQLQSQGADVDVFTPEDVTLSIDSQGPTVWIKGQPYHTPPFDNLLCRIGDNWQTEKTLDALRQFEALGQPMVNSATGFETAVSKWRTHQLLATVGIPQPTTYRYLTRSMPTELPGLNPSQLLQKPSHGSGGRSIERLPASQLGTVDPAVLVQGIIGSGTTNKVQVVNGVPIAEYKKKPAKGDFRTNNRFGGLTESMTTIDPKDAELALKTTRLLGIEGCSSVDIVHDANHNPFVLEVNPCPDSAQIETGLIDAIVDSVLA